jgi:hypothetical protein
MYHGKGAKDMKYRVFIKDSELGKIDLNGKTFDNLADAKEYCERHYGSLGAAKYFEGEEYIEFSREYSASDYLGYIEKL